MASDLTGGVRGTGQAWHVRRALLPAGWARDVRITIADGHIGQIAPETPERPGDVRIDIGIPAIGNLHSHAFQRAMAGLTEISGSEGDSFWSWRSLMYRFVDRISPDMMEAIAAYAYIEMLEAGFCHVGEFHYLHHDLDGRGYADPAEMASRISAAATASGIGLTLLPVFYAQGGFGAQAPSDAQRRFLNDPDGYARIVEGCRAATHGRPDQSVGIAPHSLRAVTPDQLAAILPLAHGAPVHIHIAEQLREVEDCLAWSGARPVQWLLDNADVDDRWCLVHATHIDDDELAAIVRTGAVVGLCPITEANLGDGIFPASAFVRAGGRYGIGSDSNVRIDLTEELRLLEYGQRLHARGRNMLAAPGLSTGRSLLGAACEGGARALGVAGGLVAGASADIVTLRQDDSGFVGRAGDALLDTLIFARGQAGIADAWRGGKRLVVDGRHIGRDAIEARYRQALTELLAQ
ncbi:MAG: formimidoylglutamate deiminase [Sphingomonadales bacterium]